MKTLKKMDNFLKEYGMAYLIGVNVSSEIFLIASLFAGLFIGVFEISVGIHEPIIVFGSCIGGMFVPTCILINSNKADNDAMLEDIKLIYEMLKIQIHAGVYIIDALENCCGMIRNKRLKMALIRLLNEIFMSRNVNDALDNFNASFRNSHIDTLVIILKQSMESGYSVSNLDSAFEQVVDVERAINIKMENSVERSTQILQVLFMAGIIAISVYCSIVEFKELFSIF